jgi:trigger factor
MNVSIETLTGLERRLTIAIDSDAFEEQITARLQTARGQVKIPGFRAGKVPMKEVRRRYGDAVRSEVAGEMMQSSFMTAVQQEDMNPASSPKLDVVKMDPGIDFEFTATFDVFPTVELANFDRVNVKRPSAEIEDADLETMIARLREQHATQEPAVRPAQDGDQVIVDFTGELDGERVEEACGEGMTFTIGQGQMIEDFDKGVVGLGAGEESTFDAVFPTIIGQRNCKVRRSSFLSKSQR